MSSSHVPLYKPWKVKASSITFTNMLRRKCTGCPTYSACRGDDCKSTEGYTEEMVKRVHESFIFTITSRHCSHFATVAACAALVAPAYFTSPPSSAVSLAAGAQSLERRKSGTQGAGGQSDESEDKSGSQGTGTSIPQKGKSGTQGASSKRAREDKSGAQGTGTPAGTGTMLSLALGGQGEWGKFLTYGDQPPLFPLGVAAIRGRHP